MDFFPFQGPSGVSLQMIHQLRDWNRRPADDQVDVIGHDRASPYRQSRASHITSKPAGDGPRLNSRELHGRILQCGLGHLSKRPVMPTICKGASLDRLRRGAVAE
jgi:hypothetical protein